MLSEFMGRPAETAMITVNVSKAPSSTPSATTSPTGTEMQ